MKRFLTAVGVDYEQWKALTIAGLRMDLRTVSRGGTRRVTNNTLRPIIIQLMVYGVFGAFMAVAVWWIGDLYTAAVIVVTYVIVIVASAMLVEHNAAVIAPTHYAVLAFQPVDSRTWLAARMANVLVYTLALASAVGLPPAAAFFLKHGFAVGSAATIAIYVSAISVTLFMIVGYLAIARLVGAKRLRKALTYFQLVTSFALFGSFFFFMEGNSRSMLESFTVQKSGWLLLYPGTWFASYAELAAGRFGAAEILPALASLLLLGATALALRGRLSLEYAGQLGAIASTSAPRRPGSWAGRRGRLFRAGEGRAMAILLWAQFRNDLRFRMSVITILPLTGLYLFMGLRDADPAGGNDYVDLSLVTTAVLLFPAMLKLNLSRSDSFRASWIFFATPTDRTRLIRASTNVLVAFFLLPYLLFVAGLLLWFTRDVGYVALYVMLAGLMGYLALQLVTMFEPELPFSKPIAVGQSTGRTFAAILGVGAMAGVLALGLRFVQDRPVAIIVAVSGIVATGLLLDRLTRARMARQSEALEFRG